MTVQSVTAKCDGCQWTPDMDDPSISQIVFHVFATGHVYMFYGAEREA